MRLWRVGERRLRAEGKVDICERSGCLWSVMSNARGLMDSSRRDTFARDSMRVAKILVKEIRVVLSFGIIRQITSLFK